MSRPAAVWCLVLTTTLSTLSGCATLKFPWEKRTPVASLKNPVVQVVCLWEPSEGRDPDGKPCRGFAGQIMFIGNKGGTPVAVDGSVRIEEYEDQAGVTEEGEPLHIFQFDAKTWKTHLHVGTLGPSYHVFIPYMRKGPHEARCMLQTFYTPEKNGAPMSSGITQIALGGTKAKPTANVAATQPAPTRTVRTTTIALDGSSSHDTATPAPRSRMEQILQEYMAEQSVTTSPQHVTHRSPQPEMTRERLRLDGSPIQQGADWQEEEESTSVRTAGMRIPATRAPRNYLSGHPLADAEHEPEQPQRMAIAAGPKRRHPLSDAGGMEVAEKPRVDAESMGDSELDDAPRWSAAEKLSGHARLADDLEGQTSEIR